MIKQTCIIFLILILQCTAQTHDCSEHTNAADCAVDSHCFWCDENDENCEMNDQCVALPIKYNQEGTQDLVLSDREEGVYFVEEYIEIVMLIMVVLCLAVPMIAFILSLMILTATEDREKFVAYGLFVLYYVLFFGVPFVFVCGLVYRTSSMVQLVMILTGFQIGMPLLGTVLVVPALFVCYV
eukprot:TRINITY_DN7011_c0_g1_i1.p1 TRINITY_DN7011_c0_g1~~TRINITY_DN7011_c0_g1_i1.p1  ORF type:complete len:197 (+),score=20.37 TRINITY_DN7011_c0_g1_i1:45-593(+)